MKPEINIVWFKRDLRFTDHAPLYFAQKAAEPILFLYCFEPSVMAGPDSDVRHWRFVYQGLQNMQEKLTDVNSSLYIFQNEVLTVLAAIEKALIAAIIPSNIFTPTLAASAGAL